MASARSDYAWDLYVMNADGTGLTRLTGWEGYDGDPVWSPDGTMLAFASDRDATDGQLRDNRSNDNPVAGISIYLIDAGGSEVTRLTGPQDGNAFPNDWSE